MNLNIDRLSWWQILLLLIVCIAALLGLFVFNAWILSIVWNWVMVSVFSLPFLNLYLFQILLSGIQLLLYWLGIMQKRNYYAKVHDSTSNL